LKKYETNKLFYNEYLYKLSVENRLASIFRNRNFSFARKVLDELQHNYNEGKPLLRQYYKRADNISEQTFLEAKRLYSFLSKKEDFTLRIEVGSMNIYSNDKDWLVDIATSINSENIISLHSPNPLYEHDIDKNTILLNHPFPYNYKVTFGNRKSNPGFVNFAKSNPHLIKIGPIASQVLETDGYVQNMYFYARDEKTIQLCHLMLGNIRRIDKLVVKSNLDK